MSGYVYLVGSGPGDPELLTVKAARLIAAADDLVVDALVPPALYAGVPGRVVYVGKRAGRPHVSQEEIGRILVDLAKAGRTVVRLKGGDVGLFARAAEEIDSLAAAGIGWEIVPGVSSALAAPALAGVPVSERGVADRVLVITGHKRAGGSSPVPALPSFDARQTLIVLMGLGHLEQLVAAALACGYPRQLDCLAVSCAGRDDQRQVAAPLGEFAVAVRRAELGAPTTLIMGRVARRARKHLCRGLWRGQTPTLDTFYMSSVQS